MAAGIMKRFMTSQTGSNGSRNQAVVEKSSKRNHGQRQQAGYLGAPLDDILTREGSCVPCLVTKITAFIIDKGLDQEGIFRVPGNTRVVERLRSSFDKNGDAELTSTGDVMAVASVLKLFLRELPDTLVPAQLTQLFVAAQEDSVENAKRCLDTTHDLLQRLPRSNYATLKYLISFLILVSKEEKFNKMNYMALATVFGPNIFRCSSSHLAGLKEQGITNCVTLMFLTKFNDLFLEKGEISPYEANYTLSDCNLNRLSSLATEKVSPSEQLQSSTAVANSVVVPKLSTAGNDLHPTASTRSSSAKTPMMVVSLGEKRGALQLQLSSGDAERQSSTDEDDDVVNRSASPMLLDSDMAEEMIDLESSFSLELVEAIRSTIRNYLFGEKLGEASYDLRHGKSKSLDDADSLRSCTSNDEQNDSDVDAQDTKLMTTSNKTKIISNNGRQHTNVSMRIDSGAVSDDDSEGSSIEHVSASDNEKPRNSIPSVPSRSRNVVPFDAAPKSRVAATTRRQDRKDSSPPPPIPPKMFRGPRDTFVSPDDSGGSEDDNPAHQGSRPDGRYKNSQTGKDGGERGGRGGGSSGSRQVANDRQAWSKPSSADTGRSGSKQTAVNDKEKSNDKQIRSTGLTEKTDELKQLHKRIQNYKKRIRELEADFEDEHGYKPTAADKAADPIIKKCYQELNIARDDLNELRDAVQRDDDYIERLIEAHEDPQDAPGRGGGRGSAGRTSGPVTLTGPVVGTMSSMEESLHQLQNRLSAKRREAKRPDEFSKMTRDQIVDEKICIQKALLYFETKHGRPTTVAEKSLMHPLYDRYRKCKQLLKNKRTSSDEEEVEDGPIANLSFLSSLTQSTVASKRGQSSSANNAQRNVGGVRSSDQRGGAPLKDSHQAMIGTKSRSTEQASDRLNAALKENQTFNLAELSTSQLSKELQKTKLEKRRLQVELHEFEESFQRQYGRPLDKAGRLPFEDDYLDYKKVKAKLKLLEALMAKREQYGQ